MNKKDFFVSYNKDDKTWAKWIAGTLEENGYTVYLQAWDISHGDDFIDQMNKFLEYSKGYIPIVSNSFLGSPYCKKELSTAFNEHLNGIIDKFLPIRVEDVSLGPIFKTTVYIDLFDADESEAEKTLLNGIGLTENPRKKSAFPGKPPTHVSNYLNKTTIDKAKFPGVTKSSTIRRYPLMGQLRIKDIIILEKNQNKKGDLFNRLVCDVFHALGFGEAHYNIQKSGREIDMVLRHRTENRLAIVESKALSNKVGGNDINKFVGVLDVEKVKYEADGSSVIGYFISKSGFTETALVQEEERKQAQTHRGELVLLGPSEIVRELIQGNMLCSLENAVKQTPNKDLELCKDVDLIAHEQGWIWVLYYSSNPHQSATHFALVHADGNLLLSNIAESVIDTARSLGAAFSNLSYLSPSSKTELNKQAAQDAYFKYLENELGEIQFEGMPTDKDAGSVKVNLENIFVPLRFDYESNSKDEEESIERQTTIEGVLGRTSKAAILAKPGGGKSTLIRRITLAYAYPERRLKVDDGLPERDWFPIYIRCRDLGDDATKSILEIIGSIVSRAEITRYSHEFDMLTEVALQEGSALLLVDGLDEISNENYRVRFVNQLRIFVATYPNVHLILTSRIAGFRAVAGTLAGYCAQYSIADFNEEQISSLSLKWHRAVLGDSGHPEEESQKVCGIIFNDQRIVVLAENPLLLTTLLFVKRWVGYLPTKKCQLYAEMIKLLLVTWNAVAHDRLDIDETEPQLAYVAYSMTVQGRQTITKDALERCVNEARRSLPELLGYTNLSASKFIDQVEERSSLLIQVGLEENDKGQLVPSYEFSHLSFQEYLTAKSVAEGWVPGLYGSTSLDVLKPHINEEHWKEVIPLAAVLIGRYAKEVVEYLVDLCDKLIDENGTIRKRDDENQLAPFHLANCIASEVPMSRELLDKAIIAVVKCQKAIDSLRKSPDNHIGARDIYEVILKSKYGDIFKETIKKNLFERLYNTFLSEFIIAWIDVQKKICETEWDLSCILSLLESEDCEKQVTGALQMMLYAFDHNRRGSRNPRHVGFMAEDAKVVASIYNHIAKMLQTDDELCIYSAAWCVSWSGYEELDSIPQTIVPSIAKRLVEIWTSGNLSGELRRMISWGIFSICTPDLQKTDFQDIDGVDLVTRKYLESPENDFDFSAAINLAVLTGSLAEKEVKNLLADSKFSMSLKMRNAVPKFLKSQGFDVGEILREERRAVKNNDEQSTSD